MGKPRSKKTTKKASSRRRVAGGGANVRRGKASASETGERKARPARPARKRAPRGKPTDKEMGKERIQKVLSHFGVASRRGVEEMVAEGRISVNGKTIGTLPCFVDAAADEIRLDGHPLRLRHDPQSVYYLLNKPRGVVCTQQDPSGRPRAVDLVPAATGRVYCVGRLDKESTGLILLTNDGELTDYLTHPKHGVMKTYVAEVDGRVTGDQIEVLKSGMYLDGKKTQGARIKVLRRRVASTALEIKLTEGRNREIRRMLARLGNKVRRLKRTAIGPVTDRGLKIGSYRELCSREVSRLSSCGRAAEPKA